MGTRQGQSVNCEQTKLQHLLAIPCQDRRVLPGGAGLEAGPGLPALSPGRTHRVCSHLESGLGPGPLGSVTRLTPASPSCNSPHRGVCWGVPVSPGPGTSAVGSSGPLWSQGAPSGLVLGLSQP